MQACTRIAATSAYAASNVPDGFRRVYSIGDLRDHDNDHDHVLGFFILAFLRDSNNGEPVLLSATVAENAQAR